MYENIEVQKIFFDNNDLGSVDKIFKTEVADMTSMEICLNIELVEELLLVIKNILNKSFLFYNCSLSRFRNYNKYVEDLKFKSQDDLLKLNKHYQERLLFLRDKEKKLNGRDRCFRSFITKNYSIWIECADYTFTLRLAQAYLNEQKLLYDNEKLKESLKDYFGFRYFSKLINSIKTSNYNVFFDQRILFLRRKEFLPEGKGN